MTLSKDYRFRLITKSLDVMDGGSKTAKYGNLSRHLRRCVNFDIKPKTIYCSWKYTWPSIPILAFIELCKLSGESYEKRIPVWLKKFISLRQTLINDGELNEGCSVV